IFLFFLGLSVQAKSIVKFKTADDIEMTADLYLTESIENPFIILCHQAGWSRGEYLEIAPKLNTLGYNCLAIDQRSGGKINGVINETHQLAKAKELGTTYADAEVDIISAIKYVQKNYSISRKLILWGSSYSSSLVLKITGERSDISAVLAFSPGEYFKAPDYIKNRAKNIKVPTFVTSGKTERKNWWPIYEAIFSKTKTHFLPETVGNHGSRALWEKFSEHENYWTAVKNFLKTI
ncbi:MAG: hypothetical protein AB8B74_07480, partial [Crocinitomicaceae bacterium]